jgi:hypothetical protein
MLWIAFLKKKLCTDVLGLIFSFLTVGEFYGTTPHTQWSRISLCGKTPIVSAFDQKSRLQWQSAYWSHSQDYPKKEDVILTDNPLLLTWFPVCSRVFIHELCRKGNFRIIQALEHDGLFRVTSTTIEECVRSGNDELVAFAIDRYEGKALDPYLVSVAIDTRSFNVLRYLISVHNLPLYVSQFERAVHHLRKEELCLLRHFREPVSDRFLALPSMSIVMYIIHAAHARFLPLMLQISETTPLHSLNLSPFILAKFRSYHERDPHKSHMCCFF